jgi:hypothetical protein
MSSFLSDSSSRRRFLRQSAVGISSAWLSTNWSALLSAATHARHQAAAGSPAKFEFFTPVEAVEIDAIASRIVPTTDTPGAREAGAVHFIDRALLTFASDAQPLIRPGMAELELRTSELFPALHKFSEATPDQQDEILRSLDPQSAAKPSGRRGGRPKAQDLFEAIRQLTIVGFLADPDSRGNPNGFGWKLIGREREHSFMPPFGYYDKDYPGWQPAGAETASGAKDGE